MKLQDVRDFLLGTLRGRLILGVALVHAVLMTLFIIDLTVRQRAMLLDRQEEAATALSQSLSTSAAGWLVADDISGLQELVEAQRRYPELIFAILADKGGRILAHTDKSREGQFLLDLPPEVRQKVIIKTPGLVDVAVPAMLGGKHVGWARVGVGQKVAGMKLSKITLSGMLYAVAAIVIGSGIAWVMGRRITQRLYAVQSTINKVRAGSHEARSQISGTDEAALLAREFNAMLDSLAKRDAALSASEARFRKLFNSAAVPLCFVNREGVLVDINDRFVKTFGYTHDDVPTLAEWWQLAYPDPDYRRWVVPTWEAAVRQASQEQAEIEPIEYRVTCKNGDVRTMVISGTALEDNFLATFFDITERKQAEESLLRQSRLLETFFENTLTSLALLDRNFNFIRVNEAYARSDNRAVSDFPGHNHFEFYPSEARAVFEQVVASGQPYETFARPFVYPDRPERGVTYWDWTLVPILDEAGRVETLIFSLHNVTGRKQAEEALQKSESFLDSIVENIPDMIFVKEASELRFVKFNKAGEELLGYSREELIGKSDYDFFPRDEADLFVEKDREVLSGKNPVDIPEEIIHTVHLGRRLLHTKKIAILDKEGKPEYLLGISEDITKRKQTDEALRKSEAFVKSILETVDEGFIVVDRQYRILSANKAFCSSVRLPEGQILGQPCYKVAHHIDKPCFEAGVDCAVRRTFETGMPSFA